MRKPVDKGILVTLDGSLSSDPESEDLAFFAWTHTNAGITLDGADTAAPTFTAPPRPSSRRAR